MGAVRGTDDRFCTADARGAGNLASLIFTGRSPTMEPESHALDPPNRLLLIDVRLGVDDVSPYLGEEVRAGDQFEVRGPIGGHFSWSVSDGGPVLLVGGGSGPVAANLTLYKSLGYDPEKDLEMISPFAGFTIVADDDLFELAKTLTPGLRRPRSLGSGRVAVADRH